MIFIILSDFEIRYLADKVFVHRWPHDTPIWDENVISQLNDSINKNSEKKQIVVKEKTILIQNITFFDLKKIGISVPPFKDECTLIFEGKFGELSAHAHITIKHGNYLEIFNQLISWRKKFFPAT